MREPLCHLLGQAHLLFVVSYPTYKPGNWQYVKFCLLSLLIPWPQASFLWWGCWSTSKETRVLCTENSCFGWNMLCKKKSNVFSPDVANLWLKTDSPKVKSLVEVKHTIAWSPPLFSWSSLAFSGPSLSAAAGTLHSPMCYGCMTSLSIWSGTELLPHPFQGQSQHLGCHWLQLHTLWWKHQWLQKKSGCSWYLC